MEKNSVVNNVSVYGLTNAAKVARYSMAIDTDVLKNDGGKRLAALASSPPGSGHDNALCGVIVQFDLTFSIKAWTEFQRYHFADIVSSQSTIHRIAKFDLNQAYMEYTDPRVIEIMKELVEQYNTTQKEIEQLRSVWVGSQEQNSLMTELSIRAKAEYKKLLYTNPCGMKLTAGITTNYRQLRTIYHQRRDHILTEEWGSFCDWVETLPHSYLITGKDKGEEN